MLLTDTPPRLDGRPYIILVRCETVYLMIYCVVPDISWKFHENPFSRFSTIVLTITDSENRKIDPEFKGLLTTTRRYSRLFFVSCVVFPINFTKIRSSVFPLCCWLARIFLTKKISKKNCITELYISTLPAKNMEYFYFIAFLHFCGVCRVFLYLK